MTEILTIVPRLPPAIDGVGDYASLLAKALVDRHQISTQFIACDPARPIENDGTEFSPVQLPHRSSDALLTILDRVGGASLKENRELDTLFLHYVGYGYAKRGCPQWLAAAVTAWKKAKASRKLVTMFHEVYASSYRPWSSQFWTSPLQQKIAKDLAEISDTVLTSIQIYADKIANLNPKYNGKIHVLPMFSTIGECARSQPLAARQPWLVTFGNTGFRKDIYTNSLAQLSSTCQQLEIEEIYDIGNNSAEIIRSIPQVNVKAMGILPASEISQIFSMARAGFLNYPIAYVGKSTIFAAYASHQILPVFDRQNIDNNRDGIVLGQHYWSLQNPEDSIDLATAQSIASNADSWYKEHNLERTADRVAELLR
jgi:hypothetical protein